MYFKYSTFEHDKSKYYHKYDNEACPDWLFEDIRNELIESRDWTQTTAMVWKPPEGWMQEKAPKCYNWIETVKEHDTTLVRFHLIPPRKRMNIHVDGTLTNSYAISHGRVNLKSVYGLNIPIMNYENAMMKWYDYSDKSNWKNDYVEPRDLLYNSRGGVPIDPSKCVVVDQTVIDRPTAVRTDIPHSVDNPNDGARVILSIRF